MAQLYCDNCGHPLNEGDSFCLNCGVKVPNHKQVPQPMQAQPAPFVQPTTMPTRPAQPTPNYPSGGIAQAGFCPDCGARTRAGWLFCMQCGTPLNKRPQTGQSGIPGTGTGQHATYTGRIPERVISDYKKNNNMGRDSYDDDPPTRGGIQYKGDVINPDGSRTSGVGSTGVQQVRTQVVGVQVNNQEHVGGFVDVSLGKHLNHNVAIDMDDDEDDALTAVYDEDDDALTMVYSEEAARPTYSITRSSTGDSYDVVPPVNIGRGSAAGIRISGNPFIGRVHASFAEENGELYIRDEKSANHTYVNGTMLVPNEPIALQDGDVVALGKEEFVVHCK